MNEWLKKMKELIIKKSLKKNFFLLVNFTSKTFRIIWYSISKRFTNEIFFFGSPWSLFSNLPFILYFTYMGIVRNSIEYELSVHSLHYWNCPTKFNAQSPLLYCFSRRKFLLQLSPFWSMGSGDELTVCR